MRKAWEITRKDLRITFGDRNLLLIMFAAPLVLAAIIAITFGGVMGNSAPVEHIKVAVVNQDAGVALGLSPEGGDTLSYGNIMTSLFVTGTVGDEITPDLTSGGSMSIQGIDTAAFACPDSEIASAAPVDGDGLDTLLDGTVFADPDAARAAVRSGEYAAAVIIPATFSADIQVSPLDTDITPTTIELYTNPGTPIAAQIVRSVVDQMATQFATGNVTLSALIGSLPANPLQITSIVTNPAFSEGIACAFTGVGANIRVERQTASGEEVTVNALVLIGSAQAIFFALFTANGQASSIIAERRDGTLQRMLVTPTPAVMVLLGKIMGVFVVVLVQLFALCVGLTILASLLSGGLTFIWGTNILGIAAVLIMTSFATAGIGAITAAVGKTEGEANTVGGIVALFMAVVGGAFGFTLPSWISNLSVIRWGTDAFTRLAAGNNDILLNLIVMALFGIVPFAIGFVLFRRKISDR